MSKTIPTKEAQQAKYAVYEADAKVVERLLATDPVDVDALRPFAAKTYDSWCAASKFGRCQCCYCLARQRLAELENVR